MIHELSKLFNNEILESSTSSDKLAILQTESEERIELLSVYLCH